jgi:serine/threonine protein kinase
MEPEINFEPFVSAERVASPLPWAVYRAVDDNSGRWVRLSVLWGGEGVAPERLRSALDWFAEAGYQAQRLGHPALARVISYRSAADAAWVATEIPFGVTLREALRADGPFTVEHAMEVSSRIARALADAHAAGWAHGFLNADTVWVDDDMVTVADLGLGISARTVAPRAEAYATPPGFLLPDPLRRDMQCLGLLTTEMMAGALPDPVGIPRPDLFPAGVPEAVVKRIRSLVNPQSEDAMTAAEWVEFSRAAEPTEEAILTPKAPVPDTQYYDSTVNAPVPWMGVITAIALVVMAVAVVALWVRQTPAPTAALSSPARPAAAPVAPPPPDVLTKVQVGPIPLADEEKTVRRLKAMGYPEPYIKPESEVLYIQVGAFANEDGAKATIDELTRAGFTVRVR